MRKRNLVLLVTAVLAICQTSSAGVSAAGDSSRALSSVAPLPLAPPTQPIVLVVTGLMCAFFILIAVSPLLIEEPAQSLPEANRPVG
jgi:hypothetical protein